MSALTDRLYAQWRRSGGGSGVLITTGRPARPGLLSKTRFQKAKTPGYAGPGSSVRNPIKGGSNHGISQV